MSAKEGILKGAFIIGLMAILSKVFGLIREMLIAANFQTSYLTDAYAIGSTIPNTLINLITGGAFTSAFIPVFTRYLSQDRESEGWEVVSSILNSLLLILSATTIIGVIAAPLLMRLLAPGFEPTTLALGIKLTRLMLPAVILFGLAQIFRCILNSYKDFTLPAMNPLILNLGFVLMILLFVGHLGIYVLAIGLLLGGLGQAAIQFLKVKERLHLYRPILYSEGGREFLRLILPFMGLIVVTQLHGWVDKAVASTLREGSVAALYFANVITASSVSLFGASIATAAFPYLSSSVSLGQWEEFGKDLSASLRMLLFIALPVSLLVVLYSTPIVKVIYQRGAFGVEATDLTSFALFFSGLGIPAMVCQKLLIRAHFAARSAKEPTILGSVCVGVNLVLSIAFSRLIGVGGIALATSISETALFFLLVNSLKRRFGIRLDGLYRLLLVGGSSSLAAVSFCLYLFDHLLHIENELIGLILGFSFSGLIYLSLCLILRLEEARRLADLILKRR